MDRGLFLLGRSFFFFFTLGADARMGAGEDGDVAGADDVAGATGVGSTLGDAAGAGAGESWDGTGAGSETEVVGDKAGVVGARGGSGSAGLGEERRSRLAI